MNILDRIKSFSFDPNQHHQFGVRSGIVWSHSNQDNSIFPILYISKPRRISLADFNLLLEKIDINIRK
jgi:hypothetical protein